MASYHMDSSASRADKTKSRTRASTWVPRRVYYVLRHLQRTLEVGKPKAISNKQIQTAIRFGSEGEVSQIMRWLSGEAPTMGHWAYGALQANAQQYRFIDRERMPSGGYRVTLLAIAERIDAPALHIPELVQLSFFETENDPSVIPHGAQPKAAQGGSFSHDPSDNADSWQPVALNARSQRDQHEEILEIQTQEEESARPLFVRLMAQPSMDRTLAARIVRSSAGSVSDFEADLRIAQTFARDPFFFTVARWRDGQRVIAPEEPRHEQPRSATRAGTRRPAQSHHARRSVAPESAVDYDAILAEWRATASG